MVRPESFLEKFLHDLQTPLAVAKGLIQTTVQHWDELDDSKRRGSVENAALSLETLATNVVDLHDSLTGDETIDPGATLEHVISSVAGVRFVKVEESGERRRIHVLITPERDVQQTVEELNELVRRYGADGFEIVVTSPTEGSGVRGRRKLGTVATKRQDSQFAAKVWLELDGDVMTGQHIGPTSRIAQHHSVAQATIDALSSLLSGHPRLVGVDITPRGEEGTAVVHMVMGDLHLVGAALVRTDAYDAIARATLDGLNRQVVVPPSASDIAR